MNRKWIGIVVLIVMLIVGCSQENPIVVKEDQNKLTSREIQVKSIERYVGINAQDFYNDNQLLVIKDNPSLGMFLIKGTKRKGYLQSLYVYDVNTKSAKLLDGQAESLKIAQYSPDRQYIYYAADTVTKDGNVSGFIMKADGTERTGKVGSHEEQIGISYDDAGQWLNGHEIVYRTDDGIYRADVNGQRRLIVSLDSLPKSRAAYISDVYLIGDKLYYTNGLDNNLWVYDIQTKEAHILRADVQKLFISPDHKQFAMVIGKIRRKDINGLSLIITDTQGKEKGKVATGSFISGVSWSPDQTKLAYQVSVINGVYCINSFFVADTQSFKSTQISINIGPPTSIKWNQTSTKLLLVDGPGIIGETKLLTTYVITFK